MKRTINRGDVYLLCLDPSEGREQKGTRPVLVVSSSRFNSLTQTQIVLPISNGAAFARDNGFSVSLICSGLETTGVIRCDQLRTVDISARGGKYIETTPDYIINEVLDILEAVFER